MSNLETISFLKLSPKWTVGKWLIYNTKQRRTTPIASKLHIDSYSSPMMMIYWGSKCLYILLFIRCETVQYACYNRRRLKYCGMESVHWSLVFKELISWMLQYDFHFEKLLNWYHLLLQDLCNKRSTLSFLKIIYLKVRKHHIYFGHIWQDSRKYMRIMIITVTKHGMINLSSRLLVLWDNIIRMRWSHHLVYIS